MKGVFTVLIFFCGFFSNHSLAQLTRVENTSLRMPQNPARQPGYRWDPAFGHAFPGLPVAIASPSGETNRLFVVEKTGLITMLTNLNAPKATTRVFLDIRKNLVENGEEGLLGLAFHPNFSQNGYFYIFYTATNPANSRVWFDRLSRFQVSASNPEIADPDSEQTIINQPDIYDNHNAGDLHFGPDGYLYVSLGDGGGAEGDVSGNSQHIDKDFFSGILRIDVDKRPGNLPPNPHPASSANYLVPADNPFIGATTFNGLPLDDPSKVRTEFWAVGLRNPWRMSFDPVTGDLWCGDVGETRFEEINLITKGGNYGWVFIEGTYVRKTPPAGFTSIPPVYQYSQGPLRAVIGGRVYGGERIPQLKGAYIFTDYFPPANTMALRLDSQGKAQVETLTQQEGISAFGVDPSNGDLLACVGADGTIRRLTYSDGTGEPLPTLLSETGAFADLAQLTPAAGIVPYEVNLPFWSDGAQKKRWFSIPNPADKLVFQPADTWQSPTGAVWIKHFEIQTNTADPASLRRLETRLLVRNMTGIYGVTYRWTGQGDAELVAENGLNEDIVLSDGGAARTQTWRYPSRVECSACHNAPAGWVLGLNTAQMNRNATHGGVPENQITALARAGYLQNAPEAPQALKVLASPDDAQTSQEYRVRSYLAANCAQCHRPDGPGVGLFDARIDTPTDEANLIRARIVNPINGVAGLTLERNSLTRSMIYLRMSQRGSLQMPPWGSNIPDPQGLDLMRSFIVGDLVSRQSYSSNWVLTYFPDPTVPAAQPQADPDGDGASNLLEFLIGGSPLAPGDEWKINAAISAGGVQIRWRNPANRAVLIESATSSSAEWKVLNNLENHPAFPASALDRTLIDPALLETAKFYRARIFPP